MPALCKAGFAVEQAREMMGDESYQMAVDAIQKVDQELERLTTPPMERPLKPRSEKRSMLTMLTLIATRGLIMILDSVACLYSEIKDVRKRMVTRRNRGYQTTA